MNLKLRTNSQFTIDNSQLNITGSKSETNRLLLLQALFPNITLTNTSNSDDSEVMQKAIYSAVKSSKSVLGLKSFNDISDEK